MAVFSLNVLSLITSVRENVCNISNVKSHVFGFSKNVKT